MSLYAGSASATRKLRLLWVPVVFFLTLLALGHQWHALRVPSIAIGQTQTKTKDDTLAPFEGGSNIDWSRYAYTQYVTNSDYLCNSVMILELLHKLGSRADRVVMYPSHMFNDTHAANGGATQNDDIRLLMKARDEFGAKLIPIQVTHRDGNDGEMPLSPD